jgi:hypothetical protein
MQSFFSNLYANYIYPPVTSFFAWLVNDSFAIIYLVVIFIVLLVLGSKLKGKYSNQIIQIFTAIFLLLIMYTCVARFAPSVMNIFKSDDKTTPTENTTTPTNNTTPKKNPTPTPQPTPTQNTEKQLYYAVSCSTCWNEACSHNGYSYGGYDAYYYNYYRTLCQSCSCNNYKAQSLWR